jgi:hypothetical protein
MVRGHTNSALVESLPGTKRADLWAWLPASNAANGERLDA